MLVLDLTKREVALRYKGSFFGVLWSFLTPLFLLFVYTFVFTVIFKSRWSTGLSTGSKFEYALLLFAGLTLYNFLAEVVMQTPGVISENTNFVKKVVFPLSILPIVKTGAALFHLFISIIVLLLFTVYVKGGLSITVLMFPFILLPLIIMVLGFGWIFASLGPYIKDISLVLGPIVTATLFLGPILYPREALPEALMPWVNFNPLTIPLEQLQNVIVWGVLPDFFQLSIYTLVAFVVALFGYCLFRRVQPGFSDVL